jgi:hypothetical protein
VAGHVAGYQPDPAALERERVVPVADGGPLGGGQVAYREVQSRDLGQGVRQKGALQRFGDGVLAAKVSVLASPTASLRPSSSIIWTSVAPNWGRSAPRPSTMTPSGSCPASKYSTRAPGTSSR